MRHEPADPGEHGPQRVHRRREHLDRVARHVLGDDVAVPVEDRAPRRGERDRAQPVGLGPELELLVLDDLGPEERADQQHEGGDQHQLGDVGALADPVGVEAVHTSSLMANHSRNAASTSSANTAVESAWSGLFRVSSPGTPALGRAAGEQQDEIAHPERHRHEGGVDQQVVGEEDRPSPRREVADHVCASAPAPNAAGVSASFTSPTTKPGDRPRPGPGPHGEEHQRDEQEVGAHPRAPEPRPQIEVQQHQQRHHQRELDPVGAGGGHRADLSARAPSRAGCRARGRRGRRRLGPRRRGESRRPWRRHSRRRASRRGGLRRGSESAAAPWRSSRGASLRAPSRWGRRAPGWCRRTTPAPARGAPSRGWPPAAAGRPAPTRPARARPRSPCPPECPLG